MKLKLVGNNKINTKINLSLTKSVCTYVQTFKAFAKKKKKLNNPRQFYNLNLLYISLQSVHLNIGMKSHMIFISNKVIRLMTGGNQPGSRGLSDGLALPHLPH